MPQSDPNLEERVTALENAMRDCQRSSTATDAPFREPWWETLAGTFEADPLFDEIIEAGSAHRRSLPEDEP